LITRVRDVDAAPLEPFDGLLPVAARELKSELAEVRREYFDLGAFAELGFARGTHGELL